MPDDDGKSVEYLSCPMHFIPANVWEWHEEFAYIQKYPHTAEPFAKVDPRKRAFEAYYLGRVREFEDLKRRNNG